MADTVSAKSIRYHHEMTSKQAIMHELVVTLKYSVYVFIDQLVCAGFVVSEACFWFFFLLLLVDSIVYDSNYLTGYISFGKQMIRFITNSVFSLVGIFLSWLCLDTFGNFEIRIIGNQTHIYFAFTDTTYSGICGFTMFMAVGLASIFAVLRTFINLAGLIGKLFAIMFGRIEVEDEIPVEDEEEEEAA